MKHLWVLLALLAGAPQHAPELQLNLVAAPAPPPPRPEEMGRGEGCGSAEGMSNRAAKTTPFTVTLADTDRLAYELGDTMSFTVIIENTSAAPLVLGISRDPHVAPKTMRPCRVVPPGVHFSVALVAVSKTGARTLIAFGYGYYGSPDVPGTTLVLEPGERVRVQLPADIRPGRGWNRSLTTDSQSVHIKASVMIEAEVMRAVDSNNTLAIELSDRIRRHD
jgi:hypothetical protein